MPYTRKEAIPLADNIRFLRKRLGISQAALGEHVGLSRSNIASYENSKAEPRAAKLAELAKFFGVPLEQLIVGQFERPAYAPARATHVGPATEVAHRLAKFTQRNERLRGILQDLERQHTEVTGSPRERADLALINAQFERMLKAMSDLLANDEQIAEVLQVVRVEAA